MRLNLSDQSGGRLVTEAKQKLMFSAWCLEKLFGDTSQPYNLTVLDTCLDRSSSQTPVLALGA